MDTYTYGNKHKNNYYSSLTTASFTEKGIILSPSSCPEITYWESASNGIMILDAKKENAEIFLTNKLHDYEIYENDQHFLYLNRGLRRSFKYLVATHKDYIDKTGIISQFEQAGIPDDKVFYVISGSDREDHEGNMLHTTHNFWEYGALLRASRVEDNPPEYWLLIHDTCLLGPNFKRNTERFEINIDFDVISLNDSNQFNIGFYKHSFLRKNQDYLESLKNITKEEGIEIEINAHIRNRGSHTSCMNHREIYAQKEVCVWGGSSRLEFYIPTLDLYKYLLYIGKEGTFFASHPNQP